MQQPAKGWYERRSDGEKVALIGGISAILTTLLTVGGSLATGILQLPPATPSSESSGPTPEPTGGIPSHNSSGPQQAGSATPTVSTNSAGPVKDPRQNRRENPVEVSNYYALDLDSTKGNYGLTQDYSVYGLDLTISIPDHISTFREVARAFETSDLAFCNRSTVRFRDIKDADFKAGKAFCVATTEKKWVRVKIVDIQHDSNPATVTLAIEILGDVS